MDRVHDWLGHNKATLPNESSSFVMNEKQPMINTKPQQVHNSVKKTSSTKTESVENKIPVVYKIQGEEEAFTTYFNGKTMTLGQFKKLIRKKGTYKYFFRNINTIFEGEKTLFEEITDEKQLVPMYKGKFTAQLQPID